MELENLLDLPEADLQKFVPKVGHWSKLCRIRRDLEQNVNVTINGKTKPPSPPAQKVPDKSLEDFLNESGLDISLYHPRLEGEYFYLKIVINQFLNNYSIKSC